VDGGVADDGLQALLLVAGEFRARVVLAAALGACQPHGRCQVGDAPTLIATITPIWPKMHLEAIERHDAWIADGRIEVLMEPFQAFQVLMCSIPGISQTVAEVVIAETGGDLTRFASPNISPPGPVSTPTATSPRAG
jgi:transposase